MKATNVHNIASNLSIVAGCVFYPHQLVSPPFVSVSLYCSTEFYPSSHLTNWYLCRQKDYISATTRIQSQIQFNAWNIVKGTLLASYSYFQHLGAKLKIMENPGCMPYQPFWIQLAIFANINFCLQDLSFTIIKLIFIEVWHDIENMKKNIYAYKKGKKAAK